LNAIWSAEDDDESGPAWARETLRSLAPHTIGVYSVEVRPGFDETDAEIESAFGGNLGRLRSLRARHDPTGTLGTYPL
jgi:hypothetical protein